MKQVIRMAGWVGLALAIVALGGCRREPAASTRPAATQPTTTQASAQTTTGPDVPVDVDQDDLISKIIVKDSTVAERQRRARYKENRRLPGGSVRGLACVPYDKDVWFPTYLPFWPEGPHAIKNPAKGEVLHFQQNAPIRRFCLSRYDRRMKRYGVAGTAILFRDIPAGSRERLVRPGFLVNYRTGNIEVPQAGYNYGWGNICFGPRFERIQFANTELFDCHIQVRHVKSGKVLYDKPLPGYRDPKSPGKHHDAKFGMVPVKPVQTPPVRETGLYAITCKKHPWHRAYLFVVDNPYVATSGPDGSFGIEGIPAGEYDVDVWHGEHEPVKTAWRMTISPHKTSEMVVRFKPPALLTAPPRPTDRDIVQWVCVGPFDIDPQTRYPPEEKVDFNATYVGKGKAKIRWKAFFTRADGVADMKAVLGEKALETTWYFCTQITSPKRQKILFGVGLSRTAKFWLNGRMLYTRPGGHEGAQKNEDHVIGILQPGANNLLIRMNTDRWGRQCSFAVTCKAEGIQVALPAAKGLRAGYVQNPLTPAGRLEGTCFVPFDKPVHLPRLEQMDLSGSLALRDPQPGEQEYYSHRGRPGRAVWLGAFEPKPKRPEGTSPSGRYGVRRAVLVVKKVASGRRLPLKRTAFQISAPRGLFDVPPRTDPYGADLIGFSPAGEGVDLIATDVFGDDVLIKDAAGKTVATATLPAYKDPYLKLQPFRSDWTMARPKTIRTPAITKPGRYLLTGKRHPWLRGHLFVTEHPYVAVTDDKGRFAIDGIPSGKHVVEVWHDDFQPVKTTFQIDIAADKATQLDVAFKVPPALSKPPKRTDRPIVEWVYAGPFKRGHGAVYGPEKKLNFNDAYDPSPAGALGKAEPNKAKVVWRRVNAAAGGILDLYRAAGTYARDGTWYLAAILQSPKAQPITIGLGSEFTCKVFLNGKVIYDRPDSRGFVMNEDYLLGQLSAGDNTLLAKISVWDRWPRFAATFKAAGVKATVPPDKALTPPYLYDERVETGQISGHCYVPFAKDAGLPSAVPVPPLGPHAVVKPAKGEQDYYERRLGSWPVLLSRWDGQKKRYGVVNAAIALRNVRTGRRYPLTATSMTVGRSGRVETTQNLNYGREVVAFGPVGAGMGLANGDPFPARLAVTRVGAGKNVCQVDLPAYADKRHPGKAYGDVNGMGAPAGAGTPALTAPGWYAVTGLRHRWVRGHVCVSDNPYVAVTDWNGNFRIADVPVGKYTVEVHHPDFQPTAASRTVQILKGKAAAIEVAFKVPAILTAGPPVPNEPIRDWAAVGPFKADPKAEYPPQKTLDFKAAYEGKGKAQVAWKAVRANNADILDLAALEGDKAREATWYVAATLTSGADQKAVFGLGLHDRCGGTVWMNGQRVLHVGTGYGGLGQNRYYFLADLKRGANVMLVRLDGLKGSNGCGMAVTVQGAGIQTAAPAGAGGRGGYLQDDRAPAGTLQGLCFVPFDKAVHIPRSVQVNLSGAADVRSPVKGEREYYHGVGRPARPVWLGRFDAAKKRYGVRRAAVILRGVKTGRRLPLRATNVRVNGQTGLIETFRAGHNYGADHVSFTRPGEPVAFAGAEIFPWRLQVAPTAGGAPVAEADAKAYADPKRPGQAYDPYRGMAAPKTVWTAPIVKGGRYRLGARRHPWAVGHLFVSEHPYVAVTGDGGEFKMDNVPPGKFTVEIWHPDFAPVKAAHAVEIAPGKATDLAVAFKVPPVLADPPKRTSRDIAAWVCVGPFDFGHDKPQAPEKAPDFKAKYIGKGKAQIAWRRVNADRDGTVDLTRALGKHVRQSTWYLSARLESPKAQSVLLGVGSQEQCKLWLNGRLIHEYARGHGHAKNTDYVVADLTAGANTLLAKISSNGGPQVLSVSFGGQGVKASVAAGAHLTPAYVWDDRAAGGGVRGICFAPFDRQLTLPGAMPVLLAGPDAIRGPLAGEAAYYAAQGPARLIRLGAYDAAKKRYPVNRAVVALRAVKAGRAKPLTPTALAIDYRSGRLDTPHNLNYGRENIAFAPAGEPVALANTEIFPAPITITPVGGAKPIAKVDLPAYADPKHPGKSYGQAGGMAAPKTLYSPPLPAGRYVLADTRHPWRRAWLTVSDHPYVALTEPNGAFYLRDVPPGKYTVEVWHGDFQPAAATAKVGVVAGKDATADLAFKPPAILTRPPTFPNTPIRRWAFLGPFDAAKMPKDIPAKGADLKARYAARGGAKVAWKVALADEGGRADVGAAAGSAFKNLNGAGAYFVTYVDSPKAQVLLLTATADDSGTVWLNGRGVRAAGLLALPLKKGRNLLVAGVTNGGGACALTVKIHADGVKLVLPAGVK